MQLETCFFVACLHVFVLKIMPSKGLHQIKGLNQTSYLSKVPINYNDAEIIKIKFYLFLKNIMAPCDYMLIIECRKSILKI